MRRCLGWVAIVVLGACSSSSSTDGASSGSSGASDAGGTSSGSTGNSSGSSGASGSSGSSSGSSGTSSGSSGSSGSTSGSSGDAGQDASSGLGCAGSSHKLCEDFESSTVGATPTGWTVLHGYGSAPPDTVVASDEFHSPPHSLKTSSSVAGANRVQKSLAGLGGTTAGTHWGRVFFKVQSPAPQLPAQGPHATFVALQGNLRAGELRVVDTQQATSGLIQLLVNTPDDKCCEGTDFKYKLYDGAWHCSEWWVDQATQSYRFFLDGTEITALKFSYGAGSTKSNMPTAFSAVGVGTIFYTPTLPGNLVTWFDDLAIDDTQIFCK